MKVTIREIMIFFFVVYILDDCNCLTSLLTITQKGIDKIHFVICDEKFLKNDLKSGRLHEKFPLTLTPMVKNVGKPGL